MNTEEIIYLDNAATTYPKPEAVYTEMDRVNRSLAFNADGVDDAMDEYGEDW